MVIWGQIYGKRPLNERKPAATTSWAILSNEQQDMYYQHFPTDRTAHTMPFVIPVVKLWLERETAQWIH